MTYNAVPAVLSVAGSDSSGGAGIQADLKTCIANGVFGMSAIAALTAQNTTGVRATQNTDPANLAAQIDAVFDDIRPDAVKTGMIPTAALIETAADRLQANHAEHIVCDPVMVATSGSRLIDEAAISTMTSRMFALAEVITPNLAETEALLGVPHGSIVTHEGMVEAGRTLAGKYGCAVLVKGGHRVDDADDVLVFGARTATADRVCRVYSDDDMVDGTDSVTVDTAAGGDAVWLRASRIDNPNTHGTGCTLSSAIAANLAKGRNLVGAVAAAKRYLVGALEAKLDLGHGSGPMNHAWQWHQRA